MSFPYRINSKKKEVPRYSHKFLPGILDDVGKTLIEEWEKSGIRTKTLDTIRRAMRRLVVEKSPKKNIDEVFNIAKCDHYNKKTILNIGKQSYSNKRFDKYFEKHFIFRVEFSTNFWESNLHDISKKLENM